MAPKELDRLLVELVLAELEEKEKKFQTVLEVSPDAIVGVNSQGQIQLVNAQAEVLFQYRREELLSRGVEVLVPERYRAQHAEDRARYSSKPAFRPMGNGSELYFRRKDGSELPAEISLIPLETREGLLILSIVRDISERRRAAEALRKSEEKYRMVLQSIHEIVYFVQTNGDPLRGSVQFVSPHVRNVVGCEPDEFLEDPTLWSRLLHPDDVPALVQATREIIATRQPGIRKYRIRHKETGEYHWMEDSVVPQFDASGNLVATFGVARDVTERRRLETQLLQAQKMEAIGRLAGGVAHDFNNLLMVFRGHVDLWRNKRGLGKHLTQSMKEVDKATDAAASLTRQLLALSSRQILQQEAIDLNVLIRNVIRLLRRLIGENIQLITSLNPQPCYVKVDPGQLEQVIINLAANARDAMPNGGKLSFQTAKIVVDGPRARKEPGLRKGPYVVLSMTDTGIGIDENARTKIFEPFFTTKKRHGSTGLGLATVFGIVKQSKGHISVSSEKERGTTFTIHLPRAAYRSRKVSKSEGKEVVSKGKETVLLLEDYRAVRKLLRNFLVTQGYSVLEAATPAAALKLARSHESRIHLLVSDIVLPEMTGLQVAARLAKIHANIRVLFISGYSSKAPLEKRPLLQHRSFLQKPFSMATLARKVRDVLDMQETP